jgi:hypothetical protein
VAELVLVRPVVGPIPYRQFVGELVNVALLLSFALWFFFGRPWKIRSKVTRGELNEMQASAKVKSARLLGVLWLVLVACSLIIPLAQANFFGDSWIPAAIIVAMAIAVFAVLLPAMRKVESRESTTGLTKR